MNTKQGEKRSLYEILKSRRNIAIIAFAYLSGDRDYLALAVDELPN